MAQIYDVNPEKLDRFLRAFDLEKHYELTDPDRPGDEELRYVFEDRFNCRASTLSRVFWFHLTRVPRGETFSEGLLPLSISLPKVWEAVLGAFQGTRHVTRLESMRATDVPGVQYHHKVGQSLHAGPYAMLVRDIAGKAREVGNHDYLRMPEIIEDICTGYQIRYGEDLSERLSEYLISTVVKFWSTKHMGIGCVGAAMYYLYKTARCERLSMFANTCYDGEDCTVSRDQIVSVEQPAA